MLIIFSALMFSCLVCVWYLYSLNHIKNSDMAFPYEDVSKSPDILEDNGMLMSDEKKLLYIRCGMMCPFCYSMDVHGGSWSVDTCQECGAVFFFHEWISKEEQDEVKRNKNEL